MIYIVIFLLLLGGWQSFMNGSKSQLISGISLWLVIILLGIGLAIGQIELATILFALYVLASIFILMQLYKYSTYHKYFLFMVPIIIAYGVLISYLLIRLNFQAYLWWHLILTAAFLLSNYKKQLRAKSIVNLTNDQEQKKSLAKSFSNTLKFHILSSAIYIVSVAISFFILR